MNASLRALSDARNAGFAGTAYAISYLSRIPLRSCNAYPVPVIRHIGLGPRLIDEDQALRRDPALTLNPAGAPLRHVGTIALAGDDGFF
jgi:hypothetical protein